LGGTNAAVFDDPELRELLLPFLRNDYLLLDGYRRVADAPLLRADIHALICARDPRVTPEEAERWRTTTSGAFSLSVFEATTSPLCWPWNTWSARSWERSRPSAFTPPATAPRR
jgi:surfactin synthase thioesterase subunit